MRNLSQALPLLPALLLAACGGLPEDMATPTQEFQVATAEQALEAEPPIFSTAYYVGTCRYALWAQKDLSTMYAHYDLYVTREASSSCTYQKTIIGETHAASIDPYNDLRMTVGNGQIAIYHSYFPLRGFSISARFYHVEPTGLSVVRQEALSVASRGYIGASALRINSTGSLIVQGPKSGAMPGESWDTTTTQYTATYPQFFTSTLPPTLRYY
jgi:hypothetical protein